METQAKGGSEGDLVIPGDRSVRKNGRTTALDEDEEALVPLARPSLRFSNGPGALPLWSWVKPYFAAIPPSWLVGLVGMSLPWCRVLGWAGGSTACEGAGRRSPRNKQRPWYGDQTIGPNSNDGVRWAQFRRESIQKNMALTQIQLTCKSRPSIHLVIRRPSMPYSNSSGMMSPTLVGPVSIIARGF